MDLFVYFISSAVGAGKLKKVLAKESGYYVRVEKGEKYTGILFDTFDNEISKNGMILLEVEQKLILYDLYIGTKVEQPHNGKLKFAADLEDGPVKEVLVGVTQLRVFLPIEEVQLREDLGAVLDDERKTRTRFSSVVLFGPEKTLSFGATQYMRGYQKAHLDLLDALAKLGAAGVAECSGVYESLGIKNRDYDPKPKLAIQAKAPAKETAVSIIRTFVAIARRNESGIIADYDTEFLHDYRVSFRKVRSVLSLFKGVFSPEITVKLKRVFAEIMQGTNRLRDLDVYLLERENYFRMVPETSHVGLTLLFDHLQQERKKELKKVTKTLKNKEYGRYIKKLQKLFNTGSEFEMGANGEQPSKEFGCRLILKRYGQVCRIAGRIDANTKDALVHELRISCKKLRYLMEFFTPLFDEKEIKKLIKSLKVLQDNLGKFNDYSVQRGFLRQIVMTSLTDFKEHEIQVTEAIGALTAMLFRLQRKERNQVMKNFARFDSEETRSLFRLLFGEKGEIR